jgi:hypothetical protein
VRESEVPATAAELPVADLVPAAEPVRPPRRRDPEELAREAARTKRFVRVVLLTVAVALGGVFTAAFRIHPYDDQGRPRTMSTHTQLGMPPCNFVQLTGKPCPSCGMTTSFALLVRGEVVSSLRANWVGTVICVLWATALIWSVAGALAGRTLFVPRGRGEAIFTLVVGLVVVLMLSRWVTLLLA